MFATTKTKSGKVLAVIAVIPLALALLKTGSRGGMLGFCAMLLYAFWKVSAIHKVGFMMVVFALAAIGAAILPPEVLYRYVNSEDAPDIEELEAARDSTEGRLELLKKSIQITGEHPLLGVGIGNFPVAEDAVAISEGARRGMWHVTHNMYTQVSSEVGIPALLCFIGIIVNCFRATTYAQKALKKIPQARALLRTVFMLRLSIVGFAIGGFFLSVAYGDTLPLFAALTTVVGSVARQFANNSGQPAANERFSRDPRLQPATIGSVS
jgi:O-antigen ligase